jgi:predicted P-loop ATPase
MRDMKIAYGDSRLSKRWINKTATFEELCGRFKTTRRTTETVAEYKKLTKGRRDGIKDVGGYVLGHLRGGRRKKDTVESRSGITLDADYAGEDFIDHLEMLSSYKCAVYSTHGHTPEAPRLRVVIPLAREVTPDEYAALSRLVASEIGMDCFDDSTYEPERLMYWPSAPADGEYVYKALGGEELNPDDYLTRLSDWRDCSLWPTSSRQSEVIQRTVSQQQDPLAKDGVVGAFCRAYGIEDTITAFLPDVYEPSAMDGRYDYIPADSSAGVVLYEGKWAYSHHATDPACGKLLNAFDLVRVHKFPDLDEKAGFKAMSDFAVKDERVKAQFAEERRSQAAAEFDGQPDWQTALELEKSGAVKDSFGNFLLILGHDPALAGIAFNQMRDGMDARGELPWKRVKPGWGETDAAKLYEYLQNNYGVYSPTKTNHAALAAAARRIYHPIREYLNSLPPWDGVPRVETLIIDYFGAEDNAYVRAVTRKTFAAAVARVFRPGVKFDYMLVLNGRTGLGKSTFFDKLAGEWFSDSLTFADMGKGKDAPEKLQGFWILEIPEMSGIRKTDVNNVKAFLSRRDDNYRASYGHNSESHPRQCIIVGSTNSETMGFLRDVTGNRRFWPVKVGGAKARRGWDVADADVLQIWAEAKAIWENGEKLFLEGDIADLAESAQKDALETDEREGMVREYLEALLPENWEDFDIYRRQEFFRSEGDPTQPRGKVRRETVCNMEIWCECFGRQREGFERSEAYKIIAIMEKIGGWERAEKKRRMGFYGIVPVWVRAGR